MADLQLPGPNHKEANCIPNELVWYIAVSPDPYFFTRGVASQTIDQSGWPTETVIVYTPSSQFKDDTGTLLEQNTVFTTFVKARIRCSISHPKSNVAYHYNDLYGTHYIPEERRLYAVFRTPL